MIRLAVLAGCCAALLAGCALPAAMPAGEGAAGAERGRLPPQAGARAQDRQCLARLGEAGAQFTPVADRYLGEGCSTLGAVQLHALAGDAGALQVANIGPVNCPVSAAFAAWARFGVDRAARQMLGSPLVRIETLGSIACRNVAGTDRRSAHATGDAIDVAAFVLADGRRVTLAAGWDGSEQERAFLRAVMRSACRRFAVVLGPEYNAAHRDHFHLEGVSGGSSFCR